MQSNQKKYVKKGEPVPEEKKTESPRKDHNEGHESRGGRGRGRGGFRGDRPYT